MRRIFVGLLLLSMLGCTDKTDKNGFYIEGENTAINKETKTKYDKNGYDKDGYNKENWNKENISKRTGTKYDIDGFDFEGWNKENINKETGTKYDKLGYNNKRFNKNGIHIKTETIFDEKGNTSLFSQKESNSLFKLFMKLDGEFMEQISSCLDLFSKSSGKTLNYKNDNFIGEIWSNNDFYNKLALSAIQIDIFQDRNKIYSFKQNKKKLVQNLLEYHEFIEKLKKTVACNFMIIENLKKEVSFKLSLGIYSFKFSEKIEEIEILAGKNNIFKLNFENSKKIELKDTSGNNFETRVFFNFVSLNLDSKLYEFLIRIPLNEQIEVRFLSSLGDKRYNLGTLESLNLVPFLIKYNELKNKLN